MLYELWVASALMLIIEGIVPFASPSLTRRTLEVMSDMDDRHLRYGGLACMVMGVVALYLV